MKVAYIFRNNMASTFQLATMILPQLETNTHLVNVLGMFFFDDNINILRQNDPVGQRLAKIAKADGRVSEEEVSKIESFISNKFNFTEDERNFAIKIFQKAKSDNVSFDAYAKQLYQLLGSSPNSLLVFYELLFELAMADGEMRSHV